MTYGDQYSGLKDGMDRLQSRIYEQGGFAGPRQPAYQTQQQDPYQPPPPSGGQQVAPVAQSGQAPAQPAYQPMTGSPVSATGGIPPSQGLQPVPPRPTAANTQGDLRYVPGMNLGAVPGYQATQFSDPLRGQSTALMSSILANPETMNPNVVAQMKEAQKEQALLMQQQGQQQADSAAVAHGTLGSGWAGANANALRDNAINSILSGNRNIDIQAAQTNRQNQLDALSAALGQRQFGLGAQQTQADENYRASSDAVDRLLKQFGINQGVASTAQGAYGQDIAANQGAHQLALQQQQLAEQARQANNQLGYQYNALDQAGQQSLLGYLLNGGGQ